MNIVDSSAWLAYFANEPNAKHFQPPLKDTASLVVPTITIYEVFKVVGDWEGSVGQSLRSGYAFHCKHASRHYDTEMY